MNREILFRGKIREFPPYIKSKQIGDWIYGSYLSYPVVQIVDLEDEYIIDPDTVGQYTGYLDKTGDVKIFEGDVTKDPSGKIFIVRWQKYSGAWEFCGKDMNFLFAMRYPDLFEVIGNIYDNPELVDEGGVLQ